MKIKLVSIALSLTLSFCMKANLNNIADPNKGTGILYGYSLVPLALVGSQEVIPVALATETINFPASLTNGTTVNNVEIKFNKDIESDTTLTLTALDANIKINGLSSVTLSFTKANARSPQIVSLAATSDLLTDIDATIQFESPLLTKTTKVITIKNTGNQQALIVKNTQGVVLTSGARVNALPGDQFTYSVTLKYKPTNNFTISLETSTFSGSPTVDKTELIFTPQNFTTPQTFTTSLPRISASTESGSNKSYSVSAKLSSSSFGFSVNYDQSLTPAIIVTGLTTVNKGSSNNLEISLSHMPDENRTVNIALSQSNFLSLNKTSFFFTPATYNVPQTLVVTASSLDYIFGAVTATFSTTGGYPTNSVTININDTTNSNLDVSAGDLAKSGRNPSIAIDTVNSKLLIARTFYPSSNANDLFFSKLRLSICNLDGTSCIMKDISNLASQGNGSGNYPSIVVDTVNSKILISTENYANNSKPSLFRCNMDATSCTHVDISAGRGANSGFTPKLLIDTVNNKILLFTRNSESGLSNRISLFRCDLDGTNCVYSDISAGQGNQSAYTTGRIAAGIDYTNSKLLAVTQNNFITNNQRPSLFRCNLDGSACAYTDISAGQGTLTGRNPSLAIDSVNGKFFVAASNYSSGMYIASVLKCNLDGSSCFSLNLANTANVSAIGNTIFLDQVNSKVIVATAFARSGSSNSYPGLYRCNYGLTSCSFNSIALTNTPILSSINEPNLDLVLDTISTIPRILVSVASTDITQMPYLLKIKRDYLD